MRNKDERYNELQWRVLLRLQQIQGESEGFWFYRNLIEDNYIRQY